MFRSFELWPDPVAGILIGDWVVAQPNVLVLTMPAAALEAAAIDHSMPPDRVSPRANSRCA